jgi:hypothetical protein
MHYSLGSHRDLIASAKRHPAVSVKFRDERLVATHSTVRYSVIYKFNRFGNSSSDKGNTLETHPHHRYFGYPRHWKI